MSDDPHVKILPVPEGSIIWLHDVRIVDDDDSDPVELMRALLERAIPHTKYVVVMTEGDEVVDVAGAVEMVDRIRAALSAPAEAEDLIVCPNCGHADAVVHPVDGVGYHCDRCDLAFNMKGGLHA